MKSGFGISRGLWHMLQATFWFALMNLMVKALAHLPTFELIFFRCGVATLIGLVSLKRAGVPWLGSNRMLLALRGGFGTIALFAFFYTVQKMPLGTAVTIQYLSPVFSTLFAIFLLGESVRPVQLLFFSISFFGVLVLKGFSDQISWLLLGIGIGSAVFSALAYNMVRILREKEHPLVVVLHFQLIGTIIGGIAMFWLWETPPMSDLVLIVLMGVFTQLGQLNLTRSLQTERMASVSIVNYLGVVYALVFGWVFFAELPGIQEMLGILLVIAGVLLNIWLSPSSKVNP